MRSIQILWYSPMTRTANRCHLEIFIPTIIHPFKHHTLHHHGDFFKKGSVFFIWLECNHESVPHFYVSILFLETGLKNSFSSAVWNPHHCNFMKVNQLVLKLPRKTLNMAIDRGIQWRSFYLPKTWDCRKAEKAIALLDWWLLLDKWPLRCYSVLSEQSNLCSAEKRNIQIHRSCLRHRSIVPHVYNAVELQRGTISLLLAETWQLTLWERWSR